MIIYLLHIVFIDNMEQKRNLSNMDNLSNITTKGVLPEFQKFILTKKTVPGEKPFFAYWVVNYLNFVRKLQLSHQTILLPDLGLSKYPPGHKLSGSSKESFFNFFCGEMKTQQGQNEK